MAREIRRGAKAGLGDGKDARDFEGIKKIKFYVIKVFNARKKKESKTTTRSS